MIVVERDIVHRMVWFVQQAGLAAGTAGSHWTTSPGLLPRHRLPISQPLSPTTESYHTSQEPTEEGKNQFFYHWIFYLSHLA